MPAADEDVMSASVDANQVVRHHSMTSLDQVEDALALADAARAHE